MIRVSLVKHNTPESPDPKPKVEIMLTITFNEKNNYAKTFALYKQPHGFNFCQIRSGFLMNGHGKDIRVYDHYFNLTLQKNYF
jgi:hypothetical protein